MKLFVTWLAVSFVGYVSGMTTLSLPKSANCGDQAELMCTSTDCNQGYKFFRENVTIYNKGGPQPGTDPARYSATVTSDSQVLLTITNIQLSDAGAYQCNCGFNTFSAEQTLRYECRASVSSAKVTSAKKLQITVDNLYPQPSNIVTYLITPFTKLQLGNYTCVSRPTVDSHFKCTWLSTVSVPDGNYGYNITVTTLTQAAPVPGSFRIVTPSSPIITNLSAICNNSHVLCGIQDTPLTIECVSSGGIPAPTLEWYRGNTSTSPLVQSTTSDSIEESDGTYTVTLIHTFTPGRTDDMTKCLCRVFYPGATTESSPDPRPASALLYISYSPLIERLINKTAVEGTPDVALTCSAYSKPPATFSWFKGDLFLTSGTGTLTDNSFSYVIPRVTRTDAGGYRCQAKNNIGALDSKDMYLTVNFGPSNGSTNITGNQATQPNETNPIRLNCTSSSSNPASNITWYNGSEVIPNTEGYTRWPGAHNGLISSNILTITLTRYMDGDRITCRTVNGYGSDYTYVDLDVLYSPLIERLINMTAVEGTPDVTLTCSASSKPPATFSWFKGDLFLTSGTGTLTDNSFSYVIPRVTMTDAGGYTCHAKNDIGASDSKDMYLTVNYEDSPAVESQTALIPGIVTGVCVPLVISVVVLIICRWRKAGGTKATENGRRNLQNANASSGSVVECAMYESAGHVQQRTREGDLYSKTKKKDQAAVYAVPVKHKKELPKSATQGGENVYEDPEATASFGQSMPKKNINKDGLVYADLEFSNNSKKCTIHGLDNATTYVQVDFTKAADPLPDSDEEA